MLSFREPLVFNNTKDIGGHTDEQTVDPLAEKYVHLSLNSVSLALIDSMKVKELASLCASNIDLQYSSTKSSSQLNFTIGWIQVDNQDENAVVPVALSPAPAKNPQPAIHLLAEKDNLRSKSTINSFKLIALAVQELDLRIEERWMLDVWDFFFQLLKQRLSRVAFRKRKMFAGHNITDYVPIQNEFFQDSTENGINAVNVF